MKKRKLLFNVLLLACILTFAKTNVSAHQKKVPSGYTGIYNIDDLAGIENNPSGKYILMGDIDMTEVTKKGGEYDNGNGWTPISEFTGVLDGNGYQITGMNIYKPDSWGWAGLIAHMDDAIVRNLGMKNVAIDVSASEVGGIAGFVDGSESLIENCYASGKIQNTNEYEYGSYTGGIAGKIVKNSYWSTVKNCFNTADITVKEVTENGYQVTGITTCSREGGEISNNYSVGKIQAVNGSCYAITRGALLGCKIENNFYLKGSARQSEEVWGVKPLTSIQMKRKQYFTKFDFNNTWEIDSYCKYPYPQLKNNRYIRIKSLVLQSQPKKRTYKQGENLSFEGAALKIVYDDGYQTTVVPTSSMVVSYNKNKIGVQKVRLRHGDKEVSFDVEVKLNAKNTKLKKVTVLKKKKVKIQFNAVKGMKGYQIQFSKKRNFKGAKIVTTSSTSVKIAKLQAKKKYFFRVRTYVKYNNKNIYSGWSNVKSVKIKK